MSRIDEMIQRLCPDGVEYKKLGEVAEIGTGSSNTQDQVENGDYPFYVRSSEVKRSATYEFDETAIITAGDGEVGKVFHFAEGKYALHQRAYRVHVTSSELMPRFCYWYMVGRFRGYVEMKACSATVMSLRKPMFLEFPIPVPPLDIQHEVVRVLDSFAELEAELEAELKAELEARKAQYAHYRDELLSCESLEAMAGCEISIVKVGELLDFKNGISKSREFFGRGVPIVNYVDVYKRNGFNSGSLKGRVDADSSEQARYDVKRGDVFFTRTSETQEEIGIAAAALEDIPGAVFSGFVLRGRPRGGSLLPEYCKYCFSSSSVRNQIIRHSSLTTRALTNGKSLSKVVIPVPPLFVQRQVVDIFDRFESLETSLTDCLPAEIEARREQYEYYRDKLLDFPRKEVA